MALRLPKALWSPMGPLPVTVTKDMPDSSVLGMVEWRPRAVTLDKTASAETRAQTFWHEGVHVALWDSGVHNMLSPELEEAVCDAVGNYLAGMMKAGCLTVRAPKE